jgi:hypothetical protein
MGLRERAKRIQDRNDPPIYIRQKDGSVATFRQSDLAAAYINVGERGGAAFSGEPIPPEHPLVTAARNSSDPHWQQSIYAEELPEERGGDLSE